MEDEQVEEVKKEKDFGIYTDFQKVNGKRGEEILTLVFKLLEELPEKEIEEEYVPYVNALLCEQIFQKADITSAVNKVLSVLPDAAIDSPKLSLNFGKIVAPLLAKSLIDGKSM